MTLQIPAASAEVSKVEKYSDNEVKILKERTFVKEALYGYMNGGSDLYYEYGFRQLKVFDVEFQNANYTAEIYFMSSPQGAFGIYSQHTYRCTSADSATLTDCTSGRQYQLADGDIYLSIVFDPYKNGSAKDAVFLSEFFLSKYRSEKKLEIPGRILEVIGDRKISLHLKYVTGPISLGNMNYQAAFYLEGLDPYRVWIVKESDRDIFYCTLKSMENYEILKKRFEKDLQEDANLSTAFLINNHDENKSGEYIAMFYIRK